MDFSTTSIFKASRTQSCRSLDTITIGMVEISVPMPILVPLRKFRNHWRAGKPGDGPSFGTIRDILGGLLDWKIGRLVGGGGFRRLLVQFTNLTFCDRRRNIVTSACTLAGEPWATRLKASFHEFGYVQPRRYEVNPNYLLARNALNLGEPGGASGRIGSF